MPDERTLTLLQADRARTDFAAIEADLEFIMGQLARTPTRAFLCRTLLLATAKVCVKRHRAAIEALLYWMSEKPKVRDQSSVKGYARWGGLPEAGWSAPALSRGLSTRAA
jgi:hypothetical protein